MFIKDGQNIVTDAPQLLFNLDTVVLDHAKTCLAAFVFFLKYHVIIIETFHRNV